ncbi:hypothetical protein G6F66_015132 [Rhizopus arrhizus]|nr:hypothetical protein G6F66_015132 [Rhizopus arrhizus]
MRRYACVACTTIRPASAAEAQRMATACCVRWPRPPMWKTPGRRSCSWVCTPRVARPAAPAVPIAARWTCSRRTGAGSTVAFTCSWGGRRPATAVRGCCRYAMGRTSAWPSTAHVQAGKAASACWT